MKWCAAFMTALVLGGAGLVPTAAADPSPYTGGLVLAFCDNGQDVMVNFGTPTNRSHQLFVLTSSGTVSTTSIYVVKYLAVTSDSGTTVIYDTASGLNDLVTCAAPLGSSGLVVSTRGFFTSRGVIPPVKTTSRLLCISYGGTFAGGPDLIAALNDPVTWVCNDFPVANDNVSFYNKLDALGIACVADGGETVFVTATFSGSPAGVMDATCYGTAASE